MHHLRCLLILTTLLAPFFCSAQFLFETKKPNFLPVDEAFSLQNPLLKNDTIIVSWQIAPGYYLYRDKLEFKSMGKNFSIQSVKTPSGQSIEDPQFGLVEIYKESVTALLKIKQLSKKEEIKLEVSFQGCAVAGLCYPPQQRELLVSRAGNDESEIDFFGQENILVLTGTFFLFGLLLAFTPCVLPMLPILSAVIIGLKNATNTSSSYLATAYVVSMALTYAIFGALVASVGEGVQTIVRQDYIIIFMALFFVVMAIVTVSNFSFSLTTKINSKFIELSRAKSFGPLVTASIMGSVSAFIATPCVTPPLAAALGFILQANSISLGFLALFSLGLGMGAPLILLGSSFNYLIPRSGRWMLEIKNLLAVILLGTAVWFLERILIQSTMFVIWTIFTLSAIIFFSIRFANYRREKAGQLVSIIALVVLLFNYGNTLLNNLNFSLRYHEDMDNKNVMLEWNSRNNIEDLFNYIRLNQKEHNVALVKFYADWCIECKHIENNILTDKEVVENLSQFILINIDVTEMTKDHNDLLKKYSLYGPPAFLILDSTELTVLKKSVGSLDKKSMLKFLRFNKPYMPLGQMEKLE